MRTPAEKKRLTWLLIAIAFFFANLIAIVILVFNSFFPSKPAADTNGGATGGGAPASQTRPAGGS